MKPTIYIPSRCPFCLKHLPFVHNKHNDKNSYDYGFDWFCSSHEAIIRFNFLPDQTGIFDDFTFLEITLPNDLFQFHPNHTLYRQYFYEDWQKFRQDNALILTCPTKEAIWQRINLIRTYR